jgi:hypothetical protein
MFQSMCSGDFALLLARITLVLVSLPCSAAADFGAGTVSFFRNVAGK